MKGKLNLADLLPVFGIVVDVAALILGLLAFRKTWEILAAARPNLSSGWITYDVIQRDDDGNHAITPFSDALRLPGKTPVQEKLMVVYFNFITNYEKQKL